MQPTFMLGKCYPVRSAIFRSALLKSSDATHLHVPGARSKASAQQLQGVHAPLGLGGAQALAQEGLADAHVVKRIDVVARPHPPCTL